MRIAIVNEVSSCGKNQDILAAFTGKGHEIFNAGMCDPAQTPELTYLHTALISALLLQLKLADLVIGGCGTGQGYLNAVLQYPGITCALVQEPLDAWLARRINAPNCISLALNKGYGWASSINLEMIADVLLEPADVLGYPESRAESQARSRSRLGQISRETHHSMTEILARLDEEITRPVFANPALAARLEQAEDSELKRYLCSRMNV